MSGQVRQSNAHVAKSKKGAAFGSDVDGVQAKEFGSG